MDRIKQLIAKLPQEKRLAYIDILKTALLEKKVPEVLKTLHDELSLKLSEEIEKVKYDDSGVKVMLSELEESLIDTITLLNEKISNLPTAPDSVTVKNFPSTVTIAEPMDISTIEPQGWISQRLDALSQGIEELRQSLKEDILNVKVTNQQKIVTSGGGGGIIPFNDLQSNTRKANVDSNGYLMTEISDGLGNIASVEDRRQTPTGKALNVQIGPGDIISNVPVFMDYDQHQIHEGEMFHNDVYISNLGSGVNYNILIDVPNTQIGTLPLAATSPHFRYEISVNDLASCSLVEGASIGALSGVTLTPIAMERNGTYTSKTRIVSGVSVLSSGITIDTEYFLSASTQQSSAHSEGMAVNEFILKSDTKYLFRINSGAAGLDAHIDFIYYEDLGV